MDDKSDPPAAQFVFVPHIRDLINPDEYDAYPDGRLMRLEIVATEEGVQILGDAFRPAALEALLTALGGGPIQEMLCG